jgi:hypothetical protein
VQEIASPPGLVELQATKDKSKGSATITVSAGATTEARIVLEEAASVN